MGPQLGAGFPSGPPARALTLTHDGGVVVVMAVVGPPALNGAVPQHALIPSAINYGQVDGTFRRAEF